MKLRIFPLAMCCALLANTVNAQSLKDQLFDELECETGNCCPQELAKTTATLKSLTQSIQPLKKKLESCESKLARAGGSEQTVANLRAENQTLKTPENNMYSRCDISYRTVYRKCILDRMYFEVHRARTQPTQLQK